MLAGDLHVGEPVRTLDGQTAVVAWVHTVPGQADYYNLTVADDHTYAVGDGQYVVHNDGPTYTEDGLPPPPYFRGTTVGWQGNSVAQRLGISPASTDPLVATVFATEAESWGGQGIVYIAQASDLTGVNVRPGNWFAGLEKEVGVEVAPSEFADRAGMSISSSQARGILEDMGYHVPSTMHGKDSLNATLEETPRLNSQEINEFVSRAQGAACP